jgi:serine/threonine protein kinase
MLEPGQLLCDRYQLSRLLGEAPGRQTWLATDQTAATPEPVVVKLLAFGDTMQWVDLKLFEREAQVLQQLRHAYMPRYRDSFTLEDRLHWFGLVQDYIPGQSLKQCLDQGQHFSEKQILNIATNILHLLTYLHRLSPPVLHRDIKPSNLILGEDGYVYLIDFGAVQDRAAIEGASFTVVGSYGYTPMEQFGGRAVPASDLYALGATLIHLLTGVAPADLPQEDLRIQFADYVSVSSGLVYWIQQLTEPNVKKRFQTAQTALENLRKSSHSPSSPPHHPRSASPTPSPKTSVANLVATRPAHSRIKVQEVGNQLALQIPGNDRNKVSEFYRLGIVVAALTILLGVAGWICAFLLISAYVYWVKRPLMVQFNHEEFVLYKTAFSRRIVVQQDELHKIEDVCYLTGQGFRSVMIQTRTKAEELGGFLRHEEARWLVALLRAWLSEHR